MTKTAGSGGVVEIAGNTMCALILTAIHAARHDRRGVTAMEYAVIASMIAVVIIGAISGLGTKVKALYTTVEAAI